MKPSTKKPANHQPACAVALEPEHKVYRVVDNIGYASNPSFFKTISFPSKSSGASFSLSKINISSFDQTKPLRGLRGCGQRPTAYQVYQHDREMYEIELEDGSSLLFSHEHKVYGSVVEKELISVSLLIDTIVMVKVLENDNITLNLKDKHITSDTNPFEVTQVMPEILEVINSSVIAGSNLTHLLSDGNEESMVLLLENPQTLPQVFRRLSSECHKSSNHLSNSSRVMALECGPFSICFSFLTYSSLKGSSSTGYQSILSQNSWSSADSSPVLMNSSNMSRFINLTTALANNSASNVGSSFMTDSLISITNNNVGNGHINNFPFNATDFINQETLHHLLVAYHLTPKTLKNEGGEKWNVI